MKRVTSVMKFDFLRKSPLFMFLFLFFIAIVLFVTTSYVEVRF